jgi:hypothetical protein
MNEPENIHSPQSVGQQNKNNANYLAPDSTQILLHGQTASRGDECDKNQSHANKKGHVRSYPKVALSRSW